MSTSEEKEGEVGIPFFMKIWIDSQQCSTTDDFYSSRCFQAQLLYFKQALQEAKENERIIIRLQFHLSLIKLIKSRMNLLYRSYLTTWTRSWLDESPDDQRTLI